MDIFDVLLQAGLITSAVVVYLLFGRTLPKYGNYKHAGWNYLFKYMFARYAVRGWKSDLKPNPVLEEARPDQRDGWDVVTVRATASDGTVVFLSIRKLCTRQPLAETIVYVKLPDGTTFVPIQSPEVSVGAWEATPGGWSANGLKIHILEPKLRWRIIYNGLLTREQDRVTQHVKLNLIWVSATGAVRYPEDWSSQLAAQALALEPWRDSNWSRMLGVWKDGSWVQFGSMQGRFQTFDEEGVLDQSVYLQTCGLRERAWTPLGYQGLRRSIYLTAATTDGTLVQLRCLSYKNVLTQVISGTVRFPNFFVESITGTDLVMSDFCERPQEAPKAYTINVSTSTRNLRVLVRFNADSARYLSGVPIQHEVEYRTLVAAIDGYNGTGLCELGYESTVSKEPSSISRAPLLRWLTAKEAGTISYCVSLEERAAACPDYVGGKGASLALLASMQKEEGYRVPPGFCLTTKALEKYLEVNPELKTAIKGIEAANENYEESNFKAKCEKASSLFTTTEITGDVKEDILASMAYLRKKALEENFDPKLRFAVRSSAVGEDGEVLSAAGQNETILGCVSDADILAGVQKCWGSMFAFTSAYYRRQNGQVCLCGGGVVVQALARARGAGVLFTRHPAHADPRRLLLTANYGLGESVVSGAVEPDTFIIKRSIDRTNTSLVISETVLGAKKQRVAVNGDGVTFEDVPEGERSLACLTNEEVLRLARLGVVQDELWAAGRDIEWAIVGDEIFLLQARPITALERWTEEELLHELDGPVMSEDELTTFGNTGEVMPRPMTPLTHDLVIEPLSYGIDELMPSSDSVLDHSVAITHNRLTLSLYNTTYRQVPKQVDINIRMVEMSVHGHEVADDAILATALHRNPPRWYHTLLGIRLMLKGLYNSKSSMNASIKRALAMSIESDKEDPLALYSAVESTIPVMRELSHNHAITSIASSGSQFIAVNVLLEGRQDFSSDVCNEIGTLLSSGDVLSAEVPNSLAKLAQILEASGHYDKFRALDPKDGMSWLKKNLPHIYLDVCSFLEQHGHRAIMEFDLYTKPWILQPEDMMKVLQSLRASTEDTTKSKTDADVIAALKSPQKSSTRKVLRWVMPLCRRTVRHREGTKAHLILGVHKLRLAVIRLGKLMVKRWYLPHEDLIFFFRAQELQTYIETRDPGLLRKAIQRQQCYPNWCKLKYAELNKGWVKPLEAQGPKVTTGDVKIVAASVCGGDVVARACVVMDLSEIDQLQQGDILITHSTDIGWSPYFPILAGIVTELGGLISHGAVIAREYGLPCIVGATGATDMFRTGDLVKLSGTKGTLERVLLQTEHNEQNATGDS